MKLTWSDRALLEAEEIGAYVAAEGRPQAARRLLGRFRARTRRLRDLPQLGRIVPEWQRTELRELIEAGYRIVYRLSSDEIEIVTVYDGRRQLPDTPDGL